jgi:hypothetical protein
MGREYTNFFISRSSKVNPNLDFWFEKKHLATLPWTEMFLLTSRSKQAGPFKCARINVDNTIGE